MTEQPTVEMTLIAEIDRYRQLLLQRDLALKALGDYNLILTEKVVKLATENERLKALLGREDSHEKG